MVGAGTGRYRSASVISGIMDFLALFCCYTNKVSTLAYKNDVEKKVLEFAHRQN